MIFPKVSDLKGTEQTLESEKGLHSRRRCYRRKLQYNKNLLKNI